MRHNVNNPRDDIPVEKLKGIFTAYPETGAVFLRGKRVGWKHSTGYRYVTVGGKHYKEHRVIWAMATGQWPSGQIDHLNGDRADNRIANLRDATGSQNQHAITKANRNNLTGYRGVWRVRGRFAAGMKLNGKQTHLGYFATAEEASQAYQAAAQKRASVHG